jgi:hypothetical protein
MLNHQQVVIPVDVFVELGWLHPTHIDSWRVGRLRDLVQLSPVPVARLIEALTILRRWADEHGLVPVDIEYVSRTRDRHTLQFTVDGDPATEALIRTHWTPAGLPAAKQEKVTQSLQKVPDLVVIEPLKAFLCSSCGESDSLLIMDGANAICRVCADLDHLVFLAAGDAALTRRARKASGLSAVVVRFSRSRNRYERRGILVEPAALEAAEEQCLADEELRLRRRERDRDRRERGDVEFQERLAAEITRLFPGCPVARAETIAQHTGVRGSGRVGRSAAGRTLDEHAVTAAVVASIRHTDTEYDAMLMSGVDRAEARERIRPDITRILDAWRQ